MLLCLMSRAETISPFIINNFFIVSFSFEAKIYFAAGFAAFFNMYDFRLNLGVGL